MLAGKPKGLTFAFLRSPSGSSSQNSSDKPVAHVVGKSSTECVHLGGEGTGSGGRARVRGDKSLGSACERVREGVTQKEELSGGTQDLEAQRVQEPEVKRG